MTKPGTWDKNGIQYLGQRADRSGGYRLVHTFRAGKTSDYAADFSDTDISKAYQSALFHVKHYIHNKKKKVNEDAPTNSMGNSSSTMGTGPIDTYDPLLRRKNMLARNIMAVWRQRATKRKRHDQSDQR